MEDELCNFYFEIDQAFVLKLLQFDEVPMASDLVGAMRKTEEKHRLPVFDTCVTHLEFNIAATKF